MPARQAVVDGVVAPGKTILDYGSGRGLDVRRLTEMNINVRGWDPFFDDVTRPETRDVILLLYVLNVIENAQERRRTLADAWSYAESALVVSSRLTWERRRVNGEVSEDGLLTGRGTFQKLFSPSEIRDLVTEVTGVRSFVAAPGVVYAFRDDRDRLAMLARRTVPDVEWLSSDDRAGALAAVVDFLEQRGRVPRFEEIPAAMIPLLSHVRPSDLSRLAAQAADPSKVEVGRRRTTLNTLLLLGIELFNGRGPFSSLPLRVQADIRSFFSSYREACRRADRLLMKLRDDAYVRGAMRNSVGKLTPTALYVHRRAVDGLPVVLRLYEHCAAVAAGRPDDWTLVKLHHDDRKVSWLSYPEFDRDPHPRLARSYSVDLRTLEPSFLSYEGATNRPLLHRKHEFLASDDHDVPKYRRLTDAESRAGLYQHPHLIGNESGWQAELDRCRVMLRGHRLLRTKQNPHSSDGETHHSVDRPQSHVSG